MKPKKAPRVGAFCRCAEREGVSCSQSSGRRYGRVAHQFAFVHFQNVVGPAPSTTSARGLTFAWPEWPW